MISAEAPVLFAKAAEIFITELTLRAWIHAEDNKRRTLQVGLQLMTDVLITGTWNSRFGIGDSHDQFHYCTGIVG